MPRNRVLPRYAPTGDYTKEMVAEIYRQNRRRVVKAYALGVACGSVGVILVQRYILPMLGHAQS